MNDQENTTQDLVFNSLKNAEWFMRHGRFIMAMEAMRNALDFCKDSRRQVIADFVARLEATPVSKILGVAA